MEPWPRVRPRIYCSELYLHAGCLSHQTLKVYVARTRRRPIGASGFGQIGIQYVLSIIRLIYPLFQQQVLHEYAHPQMMLYHRLSPQV